MRAFQEQGALGLILELEKRVGMKNETDDVSNELRPRSATKFEELAKYCPYYELEVDGRSKSAKFEMGLMPELEMMFSHQEISDFPTLVNKCRMYEDDMKASDIAMNKANPPRNFGPQRNFILAWVRGSSLEREMLRLGENSPLLSERRGERREHSQGLGALILVQELEKSLSEAPSLEREHQCLKFEKSRDSRPTESFSPELEPDNQNPKIEVPNDIWDTFWAKEKRRKVSMSGAPAITQPAYPRCIATSKGSSNRYWLCLKDYESVEKSNSIILIPNGNTS
ncbi:hypothetical protein Lal_00039748 [Lupinus albus]|nr:hypothetical protein Lal_00039748 [Lupinus albus]